VNNGSEFLGLSCDVLCLFWRGDMNSVFELHLRPHRFLWHVKVTQEIVVIQRQKVKGL